MGSYDVFINYRHTDSATWANPFYLRKLPYASAPKSPPAWSGSTPDQEQLPRSSFALSRTGWVQPKFLNLDALFGNTGQAEVAKDNRDALTDGIAVCFDMAGWQVLILEELG